jgi:hypothetical protein
VQIVQSSQETSAAREAKALPEMDARIMWKFSAFRLAAPNCPLNRTLGCAFEEGHSVPFGELSDGLEPFSFECGQGSS